MIGLLEELTNVIETAYPSRDSFEHFFEIGAIEQSSKNPAKETAKYISDLFGLNITLIDNKLETIDRIILNKIMDKTDIFKTTILETDEYFIFSEGKLKKRNWTIHYWELNLDKIKKYHEKTEEHIDEMLMLYENLPEEVWAKT